MLDGWWDGRDALNEERMKFAMGQMKSIFGTGLVVLLAGGILAGCSKNELASEDASDVFVEIEDTIVNDEVGGSTSIANSPTVTRRVRLSKEEVAELERRGNRPSVQVAAQRARADYCPRVQILSGTGVLTAYAGDGDDTAENIDHQAAITRSGRECKNEDGSLVLRVGAAGRAVKGPKSASPTVALPIRVAVVTDQNEVLFSELYSQQIAFQGTSAEGFSFVQDNVVIPFPETENLQILVGFDTENGPLAARLNPSSSTDEG